MKRKWDGADAAEAGERLRLRRQTWRHVGRSRAADVSPPHSDSIHFVEAAKRLVADSQRCKRTPECHSEAAAEVNETRFQVPLRRVYKHKYVNMHVGLDM